MQGKANHSRPHIPWINFFDTLTHEILHIFAIDHFIYFSCLMNASSCSEEEEESPFSELCPIDLKKLWFVLEEDFQVEPVEQYRP